MNKVIKKMWKKAEKYADMNALLTDELEPMTIEHFAELIIQECGVALSPMLRDMVSRGQAYDLIKQHFGVE